MIGLKILLVDDHKLFREGLRLLLKNIPLVNEIYETANGKEFLEFLQKGLMPDIVFMDIDMPELNGIDATCKAIHLYPELKVIGLSMYSDEDFYTNMIEAGAKGFILKNSGIHDVEAAIEHVIDGKSYFSQEILNGLLHSLNRKSKKAQKSELTEREEEVLFLICKGLSNQEIADKLFISKRTIDKHRENLLSKTASNNTAGLVMYAIKKGIVEI
jgi:DNA-binding NarL/FixJ family response regulator